MKIYRVSFRDNDGVSEGFVFRGTLENACADANKHRRRDGGGIADVHEIEVITTKLGILRALNAYASEPHG